MGLRLSGSGSRNNGGRDGERRPEDEEEDEEGSVRFDSLVNTGQAGRQPQSFLIRL